MPHLPLYNGRNYSLDTLKYILNLYNDEYNNQIWETVDNNIELSHSGYKNAFTQQCQQFGIEYKSDKKDKFTIQEYLNNFDDEKLTKYIRFWSMTYYSPNARVSVKTDTPTIAFVELSKKILAATDKKYSFDTFFTNFYSGRSKNIILATLKNYTMYIKLNEQNEFYIDADNEEKLTNLVNNIETYFPTPIGPLGTLAFFERYSESSFKKFYTKVLPLSLNEPHNVIVYGAPGTGKSHLLKEKTTQLFAEDDFVRVTFYNGYTYGQFVGTFKPKPIYKHIPSNKIEYNLSTTVTDDHEPIITYEFIAGPLMELLVKALSNESLNYCLIIEEINRTKVDAVFGNIFQLLDRDEDGKSKYTIIPSKELLLYLQNHLPTNIYENIKENGLYLPQNFYIWATMNSADQGVFPMDTAFKRRWDFKYIGLNSNEAEMNNLFINLGDNDLIDYNEFRHKINKKLSNEYHVDEDRLIAPFFVNKKDFIEDNTTGTTKNILKEDIFISKIVMYLKDDILRHSRNENIFIQDTFSEIVEKYPAEIIINQHTL